MREWLDDALFYEIYPQSFKDTNGDGIGDLKGIAEKLDYIKELGCNAIWINPCFDSPFVDAGYDVRDYYQVAPRYGTNEDLKHVFEEAHKRQMHVLLDLVPGHTSTECEWFKQSALPEKNRYTDRYIWTDKVWNAPQGIGNITGWLRGGYDREGACALNFFTAQTALNYGFYNKDEGCDWEQDMNDPGPLSTREEIKNIMRFWLSMGADGFRVDMAASLVKNDPESKGTIALWQDIRTFLDREYPEASLVSEWGDPARSLTAGFNMDFLLHFGPSHYPDLFRTDHPFFRKDGQGDLTDFWRIYNENYRKASKLHSLICIPSGNHDMIRMARFLDPDEMKIAFAFLLSMPGVPFIYYGDELGMRYVDVPHSVEGGYERTGSRSPMQWDKTVNAGFSTAAPDRLYIRQDTENMSVINAESEKQDPDSIYSEVARLIALRKEHEALHNWSTFRLINDSYPLIYERSGCTEDLIVAINPTAENRSFEGISAGEVIYSTFGKTLKKEEGIITLPPQSAFYLRKE